MKPIGHSTLAQLDAMATWLSLLPADPAAATARLEEIRNATREYVDAQETLVVLRKAHEEAVAAADGSLSARDAGITAREKVLQEGLAKLEADRLAGETKQKQNEAAFSVRSAALEQVHEEKIEFLEQAHDALENEREEHAHDVKTWRARSDERDDAFEKVQADFEKRAGEFHKMAQSKTEELTEREKAVAAREAEAADLIKTHKQKLDALRNLVGS